MEIKDVRNAVVMVTTAAQVTCADADGGVLWTQGIAPGQHKANQWLEYMPEGSALSFTKTAQVMVPSGGRHQRMAFGHGATDTGANPDFRPTTASTMERRMRQQMERLTAKSDALDRRMAGYDNIKQEKDRVAEEKKAVADKLAAEKAAEIAAAEKAAAEAEAAAA